MGSEVFEAASYLFRSFTFLHQCWFFAGCRTFGPKLAVSCTAQTVEALPWLSTNRHPDPNLSYHCAARQLLVVPVGLPRILEVYPSQISNSRSELD